MKMLKEDLITPIDEMMRKYSIRAILEVPLGSICNTILGCTS
jgi:hypothetical protein